MAADRRSLAGPSKGDKCFAESFIEASTTQQDLEWHALAGILAVDGGLVTSVALLGRDAVVAYNDPEFAGSVPARDDVRRRAEVQIPEGKKTCESRFSAIKFATRSGGTQEDCVRLANDLWKIAHANCRQFVFPGCQNGTLTAKLYECQSAADFLSCYHEYATGKYGEPEPVMMKKMQDAFQPILDFGIVMHSLHHSDRLRPFVECDVPTMTPTNLHAEQAVILRRWLQEGGAATAVGSTRRFCAACQITRACAGPERIMPGSTHGNMHVTPHKGGPAVELKKLQEEGKAAPQEPKSWNVEGGLFDVSIWEMEAALLATRPEYREQIEAARELRNMHRRLSDKFAEASGELKEVQRRGVSRGALTTAEQQLDNLKRRFGEGRVPKQTYEECTQKIAAEQQNFQAARAGAEYQAERQPKAERAEKLGKQLREVAPTVHQCDQLIQGLIEQVSRPVQTCVEQLCTPDKVVQTTKRRAYLHEDHDCLLAMPGDKRQRYIAMAQQGFELAEKRQALQVPHDDMPVAQRLELEVVPVPVLAVEVMQPPVLPDASLDVDVLAVLLATTQELLSASDVAVGGQLLPAPAQPAEGPPAPAGMAPQVKQEAQRLGAQAGRAGMAAQEEGQESPQLPSQQPGRGGHGRGQQQQPLRGGR